MPTAPRRILRRGVATAMLLAAAACATSPPDTTGSPNTTASSGAATSTDRSTPMTIRVTLDERPVGARLNDTPAARDLVTLLPLTLELKDFHGIERIGYPPRNLTTAGAPAATAAKTGDLAYYAPWGNLALFHRDGPAASPDLLVLGHLDVDANQLAKAERITIEVT